MAESQVYVVTGASKGLGRSICEILASKGFTVIGIARVSSELSKLENYLQNINSNSATFPCDLSKEAEICLLYTSPSPRDGLLSRMPSSA